MTNLNTNLSFKGTIFERNKPPSHIPEKDEMAILENLERALTSGNFKLADDTLMTGTVALELRNKAGEMIIVTCHKRPGPLFQGLVPWIVMRKADKQLDLTSQVLNSATDTINSSCVREKVTRVAELIENKVVEMLKLNRTENIEPDQSSDTTDFIV